VDQLADGLIVARWRPDRHDVDDGPDRCPPHAGRVAQDKPRPITPGPGHPPVRR
jgi:hypothetical protein